jgi:hypothetical protein
MDFLIKEKKYMVMADIQKLNFQSEMNCPEKTIKLFLLKTSRFEKQNPLKKGRNLTRRRVWPEQ